MNNKGKIVANDNRQDRVRKLCFNLERCGVTNTTVLCEDVLMITGSFFNEFITCWMNIYAFCVYYHIYLMNLVSISMILIHFV